MSGKVKSKRGGIRPGAGRPPRETPRKPVNMRFEPEVFDRFKAICKDTDLSQSELFSRWVERSGEY